MSGSSTNYADKYNRTNILATVYRENDGYVLDALDQEILNLVNNITTFTEHTFVDAEVFTTLVYNAYGNTTIAWFIAYFKGFYHPFDLQAGMIIRFPALSDVDKTLITQYTPASSLMII